MSSTGLKAEAAAEDATKLEFGEGISIFRSSPVHVGCSEDGGGACKNCVTPRTRVGMRMLVG